MMTRQGGPRGPRRLHGGSPRIYRALLWLYPPSLRRAYGQASYGAVMSGQSASSSHIGLARRSLAIPSWGGSENRGEG
jgi:hypothetical protein